MVLCLIALPIFAILGIFSVKYRKLTKDSLHCLFRTVTLRKCDTGFDEKIKADITGIFLRFSPRIAGFVYKNYKILSWIFLIVFLWSIYEGSVGVYNYANYGNCNGPESIGFCLLDPAGEHSGLSELDIDVPEEAVLPELEEDDPIIGNSDAELTMIEFGCYQCPFTKKAEPIVQEVIDHYEGKVNVQFKTFIIPHHGLAFPASLAANCAMEQDKYDLYHQELFAFQEELDSEGIRDIAKTLDLNMEKFNECYDSEKYKDEVNEDTFAGIQAGVQGTPTFFINGQKIVGPKPFRTFKKIIDKELK